MDEAKRKENISSKDEQHELQKGEEGKQENEVSGEQETLGNDYWERVADDVAAGYKTKDDENNILNEDQLPDDNERGDKTSE